MSAPFVAPTPHWALKGLPARAEDLGAAAVDALGLSLLDDDLMLPAAVLRRDTLDHNRDWMRRFVADADVALCPHGKTTMSPQLFAMQLADGCWGLTAATAHHVRIYRHLGVSRILMANPLVGRSNLDYVISEIARDPGFEFLCLVDSVAAVEGLAAAAARQALGRPVEVLLEVGNPGGRAGVRTLDAALEVAAAIGRSGRRLALRGVEAFEGLYGPDADGEARVREMLGRLAEVARALDAAGHLTHERPILSAGGSAFFDLVVPALRGTLPGRHPLIVLRSGCYITHDAGMYGAAQQRMETRTPALHALGAGLRPALEVWAHVQSRPEPTLALVGMGKRDLSHDAELPRPVAWHRVGAARAPQSLGAEYRVLRLNDQHAYLELPAHSPLAVGDLVGFGISHPCTTFDKWRRLFVVDPDYRVVGHVDTCF